MMRFTQQHAATADFIKALTALQACQLAMIEINTKVIAKMRGARGRMPSQGHRRIAASMRSGFNEGTPATGGMASTSVSSKTPIAHAELQATVDEVVALCGGDERAALRALVMANDYLNAEVERLQALISKGYARDHRKAT
jgi:hypothetical protein